MPQKDPLKERISLLEMGEAQGKLKPEHAAELERYRASGRARRVVTGGEVDRSLETPKARDDARRALATIERIEPILNRLDHLQKTAMRGAGVAGLKEYLPWRRENQQYDSAADALRMIARPATRTPGEGAMSDFESKLAVAAMPNRWSFDDRNVERIRNLRELLETSKKQYASQLGGQQSLPTPPPARSQARAPTPRPVAPAPGGWKITKR
jgi:hypothetical protein